MLFTKKINIWKYYILLKFRILKEPSVRTGGASSRILDTSLHVLFLDYDNIVDERLVEELRFLQEEFELGNFYVLQTSKWGRHAICIDALTFKEILEIVRFSSCDSLFKRGPGINEFRSWVLRYAKKGNRDAPKYLYTVESPYEGKNLQSLGHAKYLLNFGVTIYLKNPIGTEEIETQAYNTGKRTEKEQGERANE